MGWSVELCRRHPMVVAPPTIGLITVVSEARSDAGVRASKRSPQGRRKQANHLAGLAKAPANLRVALEEMPHVSHAARRRKRLERRSRRGEEAPLGGGARQDGADGVRQAATSS